MDPSPSNPAEPLLDAESYAQAQACVHCGLCLPVCPTYAETGLEADSPRGRIHLMKAMADGRIEATENVREHLDLCLDCRACEPACPSDVAYHRLIERVRERGVVSSELAQTGRVTRWITRNAMTRRWVMKAGLVLPRVLQKLGVWGAIASVVPGGAGRMMRLLPNGGRVLSGGFARRYPAEGEQKMRVGLHIGCVGEAVSHDVNRKAIALLQKLGCEVVVPRGQRCCGAIHHHGADRAGATRLAEKNVHAFDGCGVVVSCAGGCGAMLRQYDEVLGDGAEGFVGRVRDVCELIDELGPAAPPHRVDATVTYHDSCHLAHAQGVVDAPRRLLQRIEGVRWVELEEAGMCCGAAGTYNLTQPAMADALGERKIDRVVETGADVCAVGNVGCAMQIGMVLASSG